MDKWQTWRFCISKYFPYELSCHFSREIEIEIYASWSHEISGLWRHEAAESPYAVPGCPRGLRQLASSWGSARKHQFIFKRLKAITPRSFAEIGFHFLGQQLSSFRWLLRFFRWTSSVWVFRKGPQICFIFSLHHMKHHTCHSTDRSSPLDDWVLVKAGPPGVTFHWGWIVSWLTMVGNSFDFCWGSLPSRTSHVLLTASEGIVADNPLLTCLQACSCA